jgi:hypothetical protein
VVHVRGIEVVNTVAAACSQSRGWRVSLWSGSSGGRASGGLLQVIS